VHHLELLVIRAVSMVKSVMIGYVRRVVDVIRLTKAIRINEGYSGDDGAWARWEILMVR
jgi:hypothetical protein